MVNYHHHSKTALLFIAPQVLVTVVFFIWPAASAILQSFYYSDAFGIDHQFAWFSNYIDLWHNPDYLIAVLVTAVLAIAVTVLTMGFGLLLALLVQHRRNSQAVYKSLLLWPYAVAPAVAAILWRFLCHPTLGWMTEFLEHFNIDFNYLIHAKQALWVIILAASWQQFSYNFLFYFAALNIVPQSLIDTAIMDGANAWQRFWHVLVPLLSPTSFFLLIMNLIYVFFDTFGIIQVLTNGGPGGQTMTLIYKVYEDGFVGMDPGSSSAQSVVLMLIVTLLTLLQFRVLEKRVHYI